MSRQYIRLAQTIVEQGQMIFNKRTNTNCLTIINHDLEYDVGKGEFPIVTTRKSYWKAAVAELLGYIRGYSSAADFRELGTNTWNANANENEAWLNNPNRQGLDDMGRVYGVQGRSWRKPHDETACIDQLKNIVDDLSKGIDNRAEILTYFNPGEFDLGCLKPCVYQYQFSILGDTLHLHATQRSCDVPLGLNFNMVQVYVFLALIAQITGLKPGKAYHKIVNAHIYENQLELMINTELQRKPFEAPKFNINPNIKSLDDLESWVTVEDFELVDYKHHEAVKYPFTV